MVEGVETLAEGARPEVVVPALFGGVYTVFDPSGGDDDSGASLEVPGREDEFLPFDAERASAKTASACRRSASFVKTTRSSLGARSIDSVPDGEVTMTFTRTQKLTAPRLPRIVSPIAHLD